MIVNVLISAVLLGAATPTEEFLIAEDGKALAHIAIAPQATDRQVELAAELADDLRRISGARFEVVRGDGSKGIVLGTLSQFPTPPWQKALEIRGRDGREAYGIRSQPRRLLILGATDLGLDRGITRMLQTLGCRWFYPSSTWHVVPKLDRVALQLNVTDRPALLSRVIWWGWGHWDGRARDDHARWMRRNWMGESLEVRCGHAWQQIIAANKSLFDEHPEYLAWQPVRDEQTGKITGGQRGGTGYLYFYVPKGTKQVAYHFGGSAHTVLRWPRAIAPLAGTGLRRLELRDVISAVLPAKRLATGYNGKAVGPQPSSPPMDEISQGGQPS